MNFDSSIQRCICCCLTNQLVLSNVFPRTVPCAAHCSNPGRKWIRHNDYEQNLLIVEKVQLMPSWICAKALLVTTRTYSLSSSCEPRRIPGLCPKLSLGERNSIQSYWWNNSRNRVTPNTGILSVAEIELQPVDLHPDPHRLQALAKHFCNIVCTMLTGEHVQQLHVKIKLD